MHRQPNEKIAAFLVGLEFRRGRAIGCHRLDDFGNPGRAAFGEVEFLEEFPDAPVAVAAGHRFALFQILQPDRSVRPWKTQHDQVLLRNADLDRLADLVGPVIDRIDHRFLDGGMGEIPKALGLRPLRVLEDRFFKIVPLDEVDRVAGDPAQRPQEDLFFKSIPARAFRKPNHVDLGHREEALGVLVEEQQADVLRHRRFTRAGYHVHLAAHGLDREPGHVVRQLTAHLAQKLLHQPLGQIARGGLLIHAIIKGHLRRQADQLALILALGLDGAGIAADVVTVFLGLGRHRFRHLVWPGQPTRRP